MEESLLSLRAQIAAGREVRMSCHEYQWFMLFKVLPECVVGLPARQIWLSVPIGHQPLSMRRVSCSSARSLGASMSRQRWVSLQQRDLWSLPAQPHCSRDP